MDPVTIGLIGASFISGATSLINNNRQINAQEGLAYENRELQRELLQKRERHEKEMQQLGFVFQSELSKEMQKLQQEHELEIQQLNFEFQDNVLDRQEDFATKMQALQQNHDTKMQVLRLKGEEYLQQQNLHNQNLLQHTIAWYRFIDRTNMPPFAPGGLISSLGLVDTQKPFVLFDTKIYQEENHIKKILPFNPMQILNSSFSKINNEFGGYANIFDIPSGLGSKTNAQFVCQSELYDKSAIIVYANFSGTRLEIKALCNGIFSQQLYTNADGKVCVNPSKYEDVSLCTFILSEELLNQQIAVEALCNCIVSSYLQMLLDNHKTYFKYTEAIEPFARKVYERGLIELKLHFTDDKEFVGIDEQLKLHVETVNSQIGFMKNNSRLAMQMRHPDKSTLLGKQDDTNLEVYQLKLNSVYSDPKNKLFKYDIDTDDPLKTQTHKIVLLLGATGSGKTTLINGMINYILGVEFKDNVRYKLIEEKATNQANSQTKAITAYTLHNVEGTPLNYKITIIDTPGFGDTTGLRQDREIVDQVREFFSMQNGISHLDVVGFVVQSALARLTHSQRYVFDSILALFGKDVANNFFLMLTFADGQKPPALAAVDEHQLPYKHSFKFNNSALFANNNDNDEDNFDKMFWRMGSKSFENFFSHLEKTEPVSLVLTKDVLRERQQLEATIMGLRPLIDESLSKMSSLKQMHQIVLDHEADIERNKKFTTTVDRVKHRTVPTPSGLCITTCMQCHKPPCHNPCGLHPTDNKRGCAVMTNEHCTVCGCHWDKHSNTPFMYEAYMVKEESTSDDLLQKYNIAIDSKNKAAKIMNGITEEFEQLADEVLLMTLQVRESLTRLDQIALKPNPLTSEEYLNLLIQDEKNTKKYGWEDRVIYYEEAKKQANFMSEIANGTDGNIASIREGLKNSKKKGKVKDNLKKASKDISDIAIEFGKTVLEKFFGTKK